MLSNHEASGYRSAAYAESLRGFGTPRRLAGSGGWVVERRIPDSHHRDAMGPYPLFSCPDWQGLGEDLQDLRNAGLVSLVLVTDPMMKVADRAVFRHFELARPFKTHFLADVDRAPAQFVSRHHRYQARKAARALEVSVVTEPTTFLDHWCDLYTHLAARHGLGTHHRFSRDNFRALLGMPGVLLLRADHHGHPIGAQILVCQGDTAYAHMAAFSPEGYRLGASYLLDWQTIEALRGRVHRIDWGGTAGLLDDADNGLARYKRGWATHHAPTFLLGAIFDRPAYQTLSSRCQTTVNDFFPTYRGDEFA